MVSPVKIHCVFINTLVSTPHFIRACDLSWDVNDIPEAVLLTMDFILLLVVDFHSGQAIALIYMKCYAPNLNQNRPNLSKTKLEFASPHS